MSVSLSDLRLLPETITVPKSWAMVGGDGPRSYAQNSSYQRGLLDVANELMNEGIRETLDFKIPCSDSSNICTFRIADFGCSVGPNTFLAMEKIIEAVEQKYHAQFQNSPPLEFQVFFNDATANDFNTLFKTLPSYRKYFAAGVPGTFYGRLFPKSSLRLAYSSYSLHWLSKVPEEVADKKSPAWNKGSIQCSGTAKEVAKAYSAQFKTDMDNFLNARAQEIIGGGLMVIILAGLPDGILMAQTGAGICNELLGSCLLDMAKLELEEIIKNNGHFCIERMNTLNHPMMKMKIDVRFAISQFRAVFQGLLEEHFGRDDVDRIFEYFAKKFAENYDSVFSGETHQHRGVLDVADELMNEGIKETIDFKSPCFDSSNVCTFRIADFGCSAGPNTFLAMEKIIEAVEQKYHAQFQNSPALEFQVFFNDVTGNDFNTLFKTLPSYRKYFAAGVPGTFYGRLFPKSTLHLAYSSYSLHWLSKVPEEVGDTKSPAWNKGSIQCSGTAKEVVNAYSAQFKNDMDSFLNARAQEIIGGGLMVIIIPGLPDGILMAQTGAGIFNDFFGSCLVDMAKLGVISEEKVDSFNLPLYYSSAKELEEIIKNNGHFCIERMNMLNHPMTKRKLDVQFAISQFRAVFQGLLEEHFGRNDVDKIFEYFAKKFAENYDSVFNGATHQHVDHFILLKRNIN
ncbi:hypothetical protein NC651_037468 [Populus alba x Populus x berolinensis]|nr:hypothetical protein NC651_037468 [Populus alba x Populus x berolinensis]